MITDKIVRFSPKQRRVLTWWLQDDWEAIICDGAVRSGKTFSMGLSFILWAQANFDGRQFGLCGKTIVSLRRNLLADLLPYLRGVGMLCREKRGENMLIVRFNGHENRFLLFGGRDESSAALIQGSTLAGVLLDETALMPRSFVEQAVARCSVQGSRLWFSCNPDKINKLCGNPFIKNHIQYADPDRCGFLPEPFAKTPFAPGGSVLYRFLSIRHTKCG